MNITHNMSISMSDPEGRTRWGSLLLGCFLLLCILFTGPAGSRDYVDSQNDAYVTTWLSAEKARQLMRYHGTNGIMITSDKVYIKRGGHWICVYRDPSSIPEKEDRPVSSTAKEETASGRS